MAYKVALAQGLTADFRQVMPQLAAVVGGGFLLRQTARGLVGLIPGFGLIPKVAIAFAGTYATGEVIHRWCAYGERVNGPALRDTYAAALARGKTFARALFKRRKQKTPETPESPGTRPQLPTVDDTSASANANADATGETNDT